MLACLFNNNEEDVDYRYSEMYKTVRDGDKKLGQMFDGFSRSNALLQLAMYYGNDLLSEEEIDQLSDETRKSISGFIEFWNR